MFLKAFVIVLLLLPTAELFSENREEVPLSLTVSIGPALSIPIGENRDLFELGGQFETSLDIGFLSIPILSATAEIGGGVLATAATPLLFTAFIGAGPGGVYQADFGLDIEAFFVGGYFRGFLDDGYELLQTGGFYMNLSTGATYRLFPWFSAGVDIAYKNYLGLAALFNVALRGNVHVK